MICFTFWTLFLNSLALACNTTMNISASWHRSFHWHQLDLQWMCLSISAHRQRSSRQQEDRYSHCVCWGAGCQWQQAHLPPEQLWDQHPGERASGNQHPPGRKHTTIPKASGNIPVFQQLNLNVHLILKVTITKDSISNRVVLFLAQVAFVQSTLMAHIVLRLAWIPSVKK